MRVLRIQVHLQIQRQASPAIYSGLGTLVQSAGLAFLDFQILRADVVISNDGITGFDEVLQRPTQAVRDQGERLLQPRVAGLA